MKVSITCLGDDGTPVTKETSFRRELLTKCQKQFEKDKRDDDVREIRLQAIAAAPSVRDGNVVVVVVIIVVIILVLLLGGR